MSGRFEHLSDVDANNTAKRLLVEMGIRDDAHVGRIARVLHDVAEAGRGHCDGSKRQPECSPAPLAQEDAEALWTHFNRTSPLADDREAFMAGVETGRSDRPRDFWPALANALEALAGDDSLVDAAITAAEDAGCPEVYVRHLRNINDALYRRRLRSGRAAIPVAPERTFPRVTLGSVAPGSLIEIASGDLGITSDVPAWNGQRPVLWIATGHVSLIPDGATVSLRATPAELDALTSADACRPTPTGTTSPDWVRGARAAADVAAHYNGDTTHPYRLDDCILAKLNIGGEPRPNEQTLRLTLTKEQARSWWDAENCTWGARTDGPTFDDFVASIVLRASRGETGPAREFATSDPETECRACHAEAVLLEIEGAEEECRLAEKRRPGLTEEQARAWQALDASKVETDDRVIVDGDAYANLAAILRASRGDTGPAPVPIDLPGVRDALLALAYAMCATQARDPEQKAQLQRAAEAHDALRYALGDKDPSGKTGESSARTTTRPEFTDEHAAELRALLESIESAPIGGWTLPNEAHALIKSENGHLSVLQSAQHRSWIVKLREILRAGYPEAVSGNLFLGLVCALCEKPIVAGQVYSGRTGSATHHRCMAPDLPASMFEFKVAGDPGREPMSAHGAVAPDVASAELDESVSYGWARQALRPVQDAIGLHRYEQALDKVASAVREAWAHRGETGHATERSPSARLTAEQARKMVHAALAKVARASEWPTMSYDDTALVALVLRVSGGEIGERACGSRAPLHAIANVIEERTTHVRGERADSDVAHMLAAAEHLRAVARGEPSFRTMAERDRNAHLYATDPTVRAAVDRALDFGTPPSEASPIETRHDPIGLGEPFPSPDEGQE